MSMCGELSRLISNLIGQVVFLEGINYFYVGKLIEVDNDALGIPTAVLEDPGLIYNTGAHENREWLDVKPLPSPWYVSLPVQSYGVWKQHLPGPLVYATP